MNCLNVASFVSISLATTYWPFLTSPPGATRINIPSLKLIPLVDVIEGPRTLSQKPFGPAHASEGCIASKSPTLNKSIASAATPACTQLISGYYLFGPVAASTFESKVSSPMPYISHSGETLKAFASFAMVGMRGPALSPKSIGLMVG